jgi:hypothetical protein
MLRAKPVVVKLASPKKSSKAMMKFCQEVLSLVLS